MGALPAWDCSFKTQFNVAASEVHHVSAPPKPGRRTCVRRSGFHFQACHPSLWISRRHPVLIGYPLEVGTDAEVGTAVPAFASWCPGQHPLPASSSAWLASGRSQGEWGLQRVFLAWLVPWHGESLFGASGAVLAARMRPTTLCRNLWRPPAKSLSRLGFRPT